MRLSIFLFLSLLLVVRVSFSQDSTDFSIAAPTELPSNTRTIWATQYYIHQFASGGTIPFVDQNGAGLGLFADTCHFCEAALEGTTYITDSLGNRIVLNFAKTGDSTFVDCRKCLKFANSKLHVESWGRATWAISAGFGNGVKNYRLVPFRTIAVDPQFIPYGTVIYIPKARGMKLILPNGNTAIHDGYFFAGDTGGAIKQWHIDVFTGVYEGNPFPDVVKSAASKTVDAYSITDVTIVTALKKLHTK